MRNLITLVGSPKVLLLTAVAVASTGCRGPDMSREYAEIPSRDVAELPKPEHAPPSTDPFTGMGVEETLSTLSDRMYVIGETSGELKEWDAEVAGAAEHIAKRMKDPSYHGELIRPFADEVTPLTFASMNGYPQVVDELLRHESVRQALEQPGPHGLTPWQLSNLAPELTLLVINPTIRSDAWRLIPYLVKTPYYTHDAYAPYERVRASLEAAGATKDLAPLRAFLANSAVCPDDIKQRVRAANDVLATLRHIVIHDRDYGLPSIDPSL